MTHDILGIKKFTAGAAAIVAAAGLLSAWTVATAQEKRSGAARPAATASAIATVGGAPITRAAFEARVLETQRAYRANTGVSIPDQSVPSMRRQVLESMIRERLLTLEARRRGLGLTVQQAEEELKKDPFFQGRGGFDEAKFVATKATEPERFRAAVEELRNVQPALRVKLDLERESAPDSMTLRASIGRDLTQVTIEALVLRYADFASEAGEPTEAEVQSYYRDHLAEYRRPEQVRLTLLRVNQPALAGELLATETEVRAWEARMGLRADSLLAAIRGGARLEDFAVTAGGVRTDVMVERESFPPEWRGDQASRQAVFAAAPGTVLPRSVPGVSGRLIVRVDHHLPARVAPLREVAGTIRTALRTQRTQRLEDAELRVIYDQVRDSLRVPAVRIRYAVADTGAMRVPEPTAAELDRYYRGHQAEYTAFDRATGAVAVTPFARVRDQVRLRLLQERRQRAARDAAEGLLASWREGRRDARLERTLAPVREPGQVALGTPVDSGEQGRVLGDSLAAEPNLGVRMIRTPRGWIVVHVLEQIAALAPTFEQARPQLVSRLAARKAAAAETEALVLFQKDPGRFQGKPVVMMSRLMVPPPPVEQVPLTRPEVLAWYRAQIGKYSAPGLVNVRHILFRPDGTGPEADARAREEAEAVLQRVRDGADFADMARRHSDDEASREGGGGLGVFRRGMMVPELEEAAFSMRVGEVSGPFRTEQGYHLLQCLEQVPTETIPLKYVYGTAAQHLARDKAVRIARARADSLLRTFKSTEHARNVARRSGFLYYRNDHVIGTSMGRAALRPFIARIETLKPGEFYPEPQDYEGQGFAVAWVDTVLAPQVPAWKDVRERVIHAVRTDPQAVRLEAKRAELDSLARRGWSVDSLAAAWGGLTRQGPAGPGELLADLGSKAIVDTVAFGPGPKRLAAGTVSDWVQLPFGIARMRVVERSEPDAATIASHFQTERKIQVERGLRAAYDRLRKRFGVTIHDLELQVTELPPLEPS